jgi:hypothetical protein
MKTKKPRKTKKALNRLDRVEALLSKVLEQYPADELGVGDLLNAARVSVALARAQAKPTSKARSGTKSQANTKPDDTPRSSVKTIAKSKAPAASSKASRVQSSKSPLKRVAAKGSKSSSNGKGSAASAKDMTGKSPMSEASRAV